MPPSMELHPNTSNCHNSKIAVNSKLFSRVEKARWLNLVDSLARFTNSLYIQ